MTERRETDIAALAMRWMQAQGWDCYPEVALGGARCDIVGRRDGVVWAVECKTTFSLAVIAQAANWTHYADYSSVAVPRASRCGQAFAEEVCEKYGIGVVYVGSTMPTESWGQWKCIPPPIHRHRASVREHLANALNEGQKRYEPGNADGKYHTPWRETCDRFARLVRDNPGSTVRDIVTALKHHHYSSDTCARASLLKWARINKIRGVRVEEGRPCRLFPVSE